jgi:hypothetical protein
MTPKDNRPCCARTEDEIGRLCIGWCGPDCLGREEARHRKMAPETNIGRMADGRMRLVIGRLGE